MLGEIGQLAVKTMETLGYTGLTILMAMESMVIPLPSELVMPFAGFLAAEAKMSFVLVVAFSTIGSIIGSLISYYMGLYGGKKLVTKFGKYLLLDEQDLEKTAKWFHEKGEKTILIGRFVPVVRHLISIPAGIGKMNLKNFCIYTIIGATIWNSLLAYLGYILGKNWNVIRHYSEYVSIAVVIIILAGGIYVIQRHIRHKNNLSRPH